LFYGWEVEKIFNHFICDRIGNNHHESRNFIGSQTLSQLFSSHYDVDIAGYYYLCDVSGLAIMVLGAIGGIVATYISSGKIFINAHLFAGLGMVGAIAVSASLVPFMQKHDWVRSVHVAINMVVMGLFGWQAFTGVQIVQKILSSMNTPAAG